MVLSIFILLQRPESIFTAAVAVDIDKLKERKVVAFVFGKLEHLQRKIYWAKESVHWILEGLVLNNKDYNVICAS